MPLGEGIDNLLDIRSGFGLRTSHFSRRTRAYHCPATHRNARGEMTQAQLADRIGVTRQTIIAIEQGRYSPSLEMAFQIAQVFQVPLDEVFQYPAG